jgi:Tfp pilus assembly protein PilV
MQAKGFSFIEILIAFVLISGVSLTLLRQQWQLSQTLHQRMGDSKELIALDNQHELQALIP